MKVIISRRKPRTYSDCKLSISHQVTSARLVCWSWRTTLYAGKPLKKWKVENVAGWTRKDETRMAELLAAGKAGKAMLWRRTQVWREHLVFLDFQQRVRTLISTWNDNYSTADDDDDDDAKWRNYVTTRLTSTRLTFRQHVRCWWYRLWQARMVKM